MQGTSDPDRHLLDAAALCRQLVAEGSVEVELRGLLAEAAGTSAVLCTHGDILELLLGEEPEKGSTWVVDADGRGGLTRREYLPPPA